MQILVVSGKDVLVTPHIIKDVSLLPRQKTRGNSLQKSAICGKMLYKGTMMDARQKEKNGWKQKLFREMIEYWLNVLYLTVFFGVFTSYRRIILAHYDISYLNYGISLIKALVLAKVIMIGGMLHLGRSLESKPLIYPTLYKTFAFTVWVLLFAVVESAARGFLQGKGLDGALDHLLSEGIYEFFAKLMVVFFAFIPFFAMKELARALGRGKMSELFFQKKMQ